MLPAGQGNSLGYWYYLVTWILVISGWVIVNWQNNRREDRKEIRAALTAVYSEIEKIQKAAIKYHKSAERNTKLEAKIVILDRRLSEHLSYLRLRQTSYIKCYSEFIDSIMLENFETADFTQQKEDSELIEKIRDNSSYLESALELEFSNLFRGSFSDKVMALARQIKEQRSPLGAIFNFAYRRHEGIFTVIAYVGFTLFIGYVVSLVPKNNTIVQEASNSPRVAVETKGSE
ncbi:hypothetical protein [Pseudomonas sp. 1239]|uniref:hypothetical protein n=1 Tax=Pseudomonas sp. 1239 TaxID=1985343 RepID=UPI00117B7609|nr:hypothetical protein [Pseudomonas sp. 1239]